MCYILKYIYLNEELLDECKVVGETVFSIDIKNTTFGTTF